MGECGGLAAWAFPPACTLKEGLRRPPGPGPLAQPMGPTPLRAPGRSRARPPGWGSQPQEPQRAVLPHRVGSTPPRLPASPPAAWLRGAPRGSAGLRLAAGAGLPGEEGCAFIGRAPAGEVPRAAHEPEGGQGWALPAPGGGRRWDGGRPLPSRGFGIPGPLSQFPVGDGRGLGDPTQPPPLLSQTGEMDARRAVKNTLHEEERS